MKGHGIRAMVICLLFAANGLAQVINATLTGTVSDNTGALIPGVEIVATHTGTGVVSTAVTNESGTYRFASLQPGPYQVSASLPGFQTQTFQVALGTSQQIRQNFTLQVGTVTQAVEVSVAADELLTSVSSSVGNVLPERQVTNLPLIGRNVMELAMIMPGVQGAGAAGSGRNRTTFAGIPATGGANIGLQMDGVPMNSGRHQTGIMMNTAINPDMVDEMRVVVAAVDVEGRASAQIQVRTRSGTNQFRGALTADIRNSAFNANSWSNNRQGIAPTWFNNFQYTASLGGPIVRNKTFFFGMFDGQTGRQKETVDATVLTDTARQGIFRFFPGLNNGHAEITPSGSGNTRVAPVVDLLGIPLDWTRIPGATAPMQSFSIFGDASNPGDPFRRRMDPTGFMSKLIQNMPRANAFNGGDGLNTATHRWVRRTIGSAWGTSAAGDVFRRKQFHIKMDHHFNQNHRLSGSWTRETRFSDNNALSPWPNGWSGEATADPENMMVQLTSTLSPTLLNEFRWAYRVTRLQNTPGYRSSERDNKEAWDFLSVFNGIPVVQRPVLFPTHMVGVSDYGHRSPLSNYANTLSWTKGVHAIKAGVELRFTNSKSWAGDILPTINGGAGDVPVRGIDQVAGMLPPNITLAQNLLLSLSGSVDNIDQWFEIREPTQTRFLDFREAYSNGDARYGSPYNHPLARGVHDNHQDEINFFVKDDWRVTPSFTLNLGLRWDLMRVPYMLSESGQNFTPGYLGGNEAIFGYSGRSIADWMSGGGPQKGELTRTVLIGKGTLYPKQGLWPSDRNNFAPAIGFAWSPSWWGQDRTTIRGGYQIAYQLPGNSLSFVDTDVEQVPGFVARIIDRGDGTFRDFSSMVIPVPLPEPPFTLIPITQRSQNVTVFDTHYTTPYVQTFTLGVARSLASNLTLDVRYVGTRGIKLHSGMNLNDVDFRNNGVFDALKVTRAGGNAELFDRMLRGLNIGSGVVGVDVTGSEALRRHASFRTNIANGNFVAVARTLNTTNIGTVQPRGQIIAGGLLRSSGLFAENFFVVNPQFNNITYRNNTDSSNYHSLQTSVTLRPTHGLNYQGSYTWSRSLGLSGDIGGTFRDLLNQSADYRLQASHRTHDFKSYGTFELPFGPGRLLGGNSSGLMARLIEGWQLGSILTLTSGAPLNVEAQNTLYAGGAADIVGDFPRKGEVVWPLTTGEIFGNFFSQQYRRVPDPACSTLASNLTQWCTLTALADANGNVVLRNAGPGQLGTLGLRTIEGPGNWNLDANIQKSIRIQESKRLSFRVDALNVFNHPTPGNPSLNINSGTFGQINSKTGSRTLAAQIRLEF
jgi:hypothetical protein